MAELTYVQKLEKDYLRIEEENKRYREALLYVREELNASMSMSEEEYKSVEIIDEALKERK